MKLYVIRHGEIDANVKHLIVSTTDMELNTKGIKQANQLKEQCHTINYDFIIVSPLKRTKQTAEIINVKHKTIYEDDRLIERKAGILEMTNIDTFDFKPYANYIENRECPEGETIVAFCDRVWEFLNELEENHRDSTILLVTHHGVCRAIASYYRGIPQDGDLTYYHQNNCEMIEYNI